MTPELIHELALKKVQENYPEKEDTTQELVLEENKIRKLTIWYEQKEKEFVTACAKMKTFIQKYIDKTGYFDVNKINSNPDECLSFDSYFANMTSLHIEVAIIEEVMEDYGLLNKEQLAKMGNLQEYLEWLKVNYKNTRLTNNDNIQLFAFSTFRSDGVPDCLYEPLTDDANNEIKIYGNNVPLNEQVALYRKFLLKQLNIYYEDENIVRK